MKAPNLLYGLGQSAALWVVLIFSPLYEFAQKYLKEKLSIKTHVSI